MSPKIHPRTPTVGEATGQLGVAIARIAGEYDLTMAEVLAALAGIMQEYAVSAVRHERGVRES